MGMTREELCIHACKYAIGELTRKGSSAFITSAHDGRRQISWVEVVEWLKDHKRLLEQEPCEIIKEIPKDYKYDTETENFLVYRHMYTGHEIHIEKPVPRYRLEQELCEDAISRRAIIDMAGLSEWFDSSDSYNEFVIALSELPPVTSQPKIGQWIEDENEMKVWCSECGEENDNCSKCCPNCGAKMIEPQESEGKE